MKRIIAPLAGALITLSLAPFHYWPLAIVAMAALAWWLDDCSAKEGFLRGWLFGSASFLAGVSWIYVAMYVYGNTSALLSALMTILFCLGLGLTSPASARVSSPLLPFYIHPNIELSFTQPFLRFWELHGWTPLVESDR